MSETSGHVVWLGSAKREEDKMELLRPSTKKT